MNRNRNFNFLDEIEAYDEIENSILFQNFIENAEDELVESDDNFDSNYNGIQIKIDYGNLPSK